ncbi:hypothetical protein MRGA327_19780 [Mycobacterium tuberculosis RGTB327]|nr:hypothetical protein MRGA327_19780 [Mycobacterium tuberculosis RGTB327]
MALWFLNFSTWDGVAGIYGGGLVRLAEVSPPRLGPWPAVDAGQRMRRQPLHAVGLVGAELEFRCNRTV